MIKAAIENNLANQQNVIDPLNLITEIDVANNMTQACRSMLEAVANNGTILFAVDSAVVVDDFHNVVESHANLLGTCPGILLVEAHADHDGSENYTLNYLSDVPTQLPMLLLLQGPAVSAYRYLPTAKHGRWHLTNHAATRPTTDA